MINAVIDLSHHNTVSDFGLVKADGIVGVIHKATEGLTYQDPAYASRRGPALAAGLLWGAYHFGDANDGRQQAEFFLSVVQPGPQDLLVLDLEQVYDSSGNPAPSMTLAQAEDFLRTVQAATGRWPGLYGGSYVKGLLGNAQNAVLGSCWFWLSEYGSTPSVPPNWATWTMWQYTDGSSGPEPHSVDGVGNCDRDQFNGDPAALLALWGYPAATG